MTLPSLPGIVAALLDTIGRLRGAMALAADHETALIAAATWLWLDRLDARITSLVARLQAGALKPLRPGAGTKAAPRTSLRTALPRAFGWFTREVPETQPVAGEIDALLTDPEFQSMFAQEPARFGRLLRPLCHAMGLIPPEPLRKPAQQAAPVSTATPDAPASASPPAAFQPSKPARLPVLRSDIDSDHDDPTGECLSLSQMLDRTVFRDLPKKA